MAFVKEMRNRIIRIKVIEFCTTKLMLVKLIKNCTGLGLKESKDICDKMHMLPYNFVEINIPDSISGDLISVFTKGILECGGKFQINGGVQWDRNLKILDLGIGDNSDYNDFILESITYNNQKISENIIKFILNKLSKEDVQDVFKLIKKIINNS